MRKTLLFALLALGSTSLWSQTLERLQNNQIIRIGYEDHYAPFSYLVDGKPVGYSQDVALEIVNFLKKKQ